MMLDMVHDIQSVYRKILNAMSRPGLIENLGEEIKKSNVDINCYNSTFLIMLMLLDREVSFNIVSENSDQISSLISQMTYSKVKPVEKADYIFVLEDSCDKCLEKVIEVSKIGDLIDPNKSATIIAETEEFNNKGYCQLLFKGPGIKDMCEINISRNTQWIEKRREKNEEFPLGIDLIWVDKNDNVLCIPRTTHIIKK